MIERWQPREPVSASKLNRNIAQILKAMRINISGGTVQQSEDGISLTVYDTGIGTGGDGGIPGEPGEDGADGVDLTASDIGTFNIEVFHLGDWVTPSTCPVDITGGGKFWLEVDMADTTSRANAVSVGSGGSWPASTSDLLIWKLCDVTADGDDLNAVMYRGFWVEYDDGSSVNRLRFSSVTTPDVPLGTVRMWDKVTTPPIGWTELARMQGYFPVGYDSGDSDYDELNEHGGYTWHGITENNHGDHLLGHHHGTEYLGKGDSGGDTCIYGAGEDADVDEWTGTNSGADTMPTGTGTSSSVEHTGPFNSDEDTDNRPPYSPIMFIERTAI